VIDGATLRLVREPSGLVLPKAPTDAAQAARPPQSEAGQESQAAATPALDLAVRSVQLRSSTLQWVDRAVQPSVTWELTDLEATARGESLDAPITLDASGSLASGGSLAVGGTASSDGLLDLAIVLDAVQTASLAPYLGGDFELAGALSGDVALRGPAGALDQLVATLESSDFRFRRGDTTLTGQLTLNADVAAPTRAANGSFEIDATGASLALGGGFTKPAGVAARVTGRIAAGSGGALAIDDVKLVIKNFEARGRVSSLSPFRVELSSPPFELEGWGALVPALADLRPSGPLRFEKLRFGSSPPDLRGSAHLDGVVVHPREGAALTLRGEVIGDGNGFHSEGASVETAGQVSQLGLRVSELFAQPRYRLALDAKDADSNQLLTDLFSQPDTLYGPLGMDLELEGAIDDDPLRSLTGRLDFGVERGRIAGVSLLRSVFERLGGAGKLALDLGEAFGGKDLQRFYGDEFELLRGGLRLQGGVAHTDDLTLRYRGYAVRLAGTLGLADLAMDMAGELTLDEQLDAAIAKQLGVRNYQPRQRVVRLARVQGTLAEPRVRLDSGVAATLTAAYAGDAYGAKLREKAERELGPGGGDLVESGLGVLQGILGGKRGRAAPPPADPRPGEPAPPDPTLTPTAPSPEAGAAPVHPDPAPATPQDVDPPTAS
jgi:hypothetical protein